LPFCLAMQKLTKGAFTFIASEPIEEERLAMGFFDMNREHSFVIRAYENDTQNSFAHVLCNKADVVILGSAPESYIKKRLKEKKLTFLYSERIYKRKPPLYKLPLRAVKYFFKMGRHRNLYLLCASAYTAADYAKTGTFWGKSYKWGYFPEVKRYDQIETILDEKKPHSLLWVGRFLDCKHPEVALSIAQKLNAAGYNFELNLIGTGELEGKLKALIQTYGLEDKVHMLGAMSPEKVREYMEQAEIFMFTSDRNEGWGAVLNEAMNSGCSCVASDVIGSAPYLIKDGQNGLLYKDGDVEQLYQNVKILIENPEKRKELGRKAYQTMAETWNAENAATCFIELVQAILDGKRKPDIFADGPCSRAEIL